MKTPKIYKSLLFLCNQPDIDKHQAQYKYLHYCNLRDLNKRGVRKLILSNLIHKYILHNCKFREHMKDYMLHWPHIERKLDLLSK